MREILFKAKVIETEDMDGTWVTGSLVVSPGRHYITYWCNITNRFKMYIVDPETVCQYTGLKDKNGQKIFEGDILDYGWIVNFIEGSFLADCHLLHLWNEVSVVTGNIHNEAKP